MKLNSFERRIAIDICNNPSSILKWRKQASHAFKRVFILLFDTSFGLEIEIAEEEIDKQKFIQKLSGNKKIRSNQSMESIIQNCSHIQERLFIKIAKNIPQSTLYPISTYFTERIFHMDGSHVELSTPICIGNLHYIQEILRKLELCLKHPIGNSNDKHTSMHLHVTMPIEYTSSENTSNITKISDLYYQKCKNKIIETGYQTDKSTIEQMILFKTRAKSDNIIPFKKSYELRWFLGTTNLSTIFKRVAIERAKIDFLRNPNQDIDNSTLKFLIDWVI